MNDRTNEEKLRILQERLAQIKQKHETPVPQRFQREGVSEVSTSNLENTKEANTPTWGLEDKKTSSFSWIKKVAIIGVIGFGLFYIYNNMDSLFASDENVATETTPFVLTYNFEFEGNQLAIIRSFEDESSAKAMVNELMVKGFKCDYFFLPDKSNSTEKIYKVFIGPYESMEEANQWKENIEGEVEILNL
jgi:hypothetical protein